MELIESLWKQDEDMGLTLADFLPKNDEVIYENELIEDDIEKLKLQALNDANSEKVIITFSRLSLFVMRMIFSVRIFITQVKVSRLVKSLGTNIFGYSMWLKFCPVLLKHQFLLGDSNLKCLPQSSFLNAIIFFCSETFAVKRN